MPAFHFRYFAPWADLSTAALKITFISGRDSREIPSEWPDTWIVSFLNDAQNRACVSDTKWNRTIRKKKNTRVSRRVSLAHEIHHNCTERRCSTLAERSDVTTVAVNGSLWEKYPPRLHLLCRGVVPMRYCKTNYALATFALRDGKITITFPPGRVAILTNLLTITNYCEMWLEHVDGSRCKPTACYFNEFAAELVEISRNRCSPLWPSYWRNRKLLKFITRVASPITAGCFCAPLRKTKRLFRALVVIIVRLFHYFTRHQLHRCDGSTRHLAQN